jgi:hypothetical protein
VACWYSMLHATYSCVRDGQPEWIGTNAGIDLHVCWKRRRERWSVGQAKLLRGPTSASLDPTSLHHRRCDHERMSMEQITTES